MKWAAWLVTDLAVIALCLWFADTWAFPLCVLILGTRQMGLAVLGHDASHGQVTRWRWLNNLLASVCLWTMGVGLHAFRRSHWAHHRDVGGPDDPEVPHRRINERARDRFGMWLPVMDLCGYGIPQTCRLLWMFRPVKPIDLIGPLVIAALFVAYAPWPMIAAWYGAILTSYSAAFRLRAFTEHRGTATFIKSKPPLWQRLLYLPHGTWRHWEHHRRPGSG